MTTKNTMAYLRIIVTFECLQGLKPFQTSPQSALEGTNVEQRCSFSAEELLNQAEVR